MGNISPTMGLTQSNGAIGLIGEEYLRQQALFVIARLERISADSIWAHRSSGVRGSLLKAVESLKFQDGDSEKQSNWLKLTEITGLIAVGYSLLEKAAREY